MAKSAGGKDFLMEKGEKVGLGIASVLGVLFLAFGVMAMFNRPQDPETFSKALDNKAGDLTRQMANPVANIDPLKGPVTEPSRNSIVRLEPSTNALFDPTAPPDSRRIAPTILQVAEATADITALKILANDFVLEKNDQGEVTKVRVGVVTAKSDDKVEGGGKFLEDAKKRFRRGQVPGKQRPPGSGGSGGSPGGGEGMPGRPGMPGMPGGPGGPGMPGYPGSGMAGGSPTGGGYSGMAGGSPSGGGFRGGSGFPGAPGMGFQGGAPGMGYLGGYGGMGDMYGGSQSAGQRFAVEYIEGANDEEIEAKLKGRRLAITIKPQRMAVIQAAFPYRAQLEKFRVALRHKDLKELYQHPEDMPVFNGVDLQRRAYRPRNGGRDLDQLEDWQSIDLVGNSQDLRAVTLVYKEEQPADLQRVMLHEDHMLVMPLPQEMPGAGKYPELRLKMLKDAMEKQKKLDPKSQVTAPPKTRFMGGENPFKRETGASSNLYNLGGPGGESGMPGFPGGMMFGNFGKNKSKPGENLYGPNTAPDYQPPDFVYVRVYDTDIKDGLVYEYRLRVKVKNPNYGKKDQVSKASDADSEELPPQDDHWFVVKEKVHVPQGGYTYVADFTPPKANEGRGVGTIDRPKEGQAVIEFQRWYEYLDLPGGLKEPVGDWVISHLLATRGMFVTGKAFAPLPFWSSVDNAFVLREIPGEKTAKGKDPRRGTILEPVRPKTLLAVEVEGGKVSVKVKQNPGEPTNRGVRTEDEAATEVLFQYPDGSLELKSSAYDKADKDRKEREEQFNKWVDETQQRNPSGPPPKKKDDF